ncbi:MAG: amino acid permease [Hyphomicrobiales bacterium]|nr:amino acid permease [Hyphomicrobiales bacterium]
MPDRLPELIPPLESDVWWGIALGAFLAFYAFIGFEDMVNVSEEVKDAARTVPRAIILALVVSSLLYFLVVAVAVLSLPVASLSKSDAPLALLFEHATGRHPTIIALISLFAVINGALIQIIMASRMLYGMGRAGWIFSKFGHVSETTRTPAVATATIVAGVLIFALWLPLVTLAKLTSFAILLVFILVNLSLIRIKKIQPVPPGLRVYPKWVPYCGMLLAILLLVFQIISTLGIYR